MPRHTRKTKRKSIRRGGSTVGNTSITNGNIRSNSSNSSIKYNLTDVIAKIPKDFVTALIKNKFTYGQIIKKYKELKNIYDTNFDTRIDGRIYISFKEKFEKLKLIHSRIKNINDNMYTFRNGILSNFRKIGKSYYDDDDELKKEIYSLKRDFDKIYYTLINFKSYFETLKSEPYLVYIMENDIKNIVLPRGYHSRYDYLHTVMMDIRQFVNMKNIEIYRDDIDYVINEIKGIRYPD